MTLPKLTTDTDTDTDTVADTVTDTATICFCLTYAPSLPSSGCTTAGSPYTQRYHFTTLPWNKEM